MLIKLIEYFQNGIAIDTFKSQSISKKIVSEIKRKGDTEMVVIDFLGVRVVIYEFLRQLLTPLNGERVKYSLINIDNSIKDKIEAIESEFKKL